MEGDGQQFQLAGNTGIALGDNGFFNVTGVWGTQDSTSRSLQRTDAAGLIAFGAPDQQANVAQPYAQIWGQPETDPNWNIFGNMGFQVSDSMEVYAFGNFGKRKTTGGFYYRNPNNRGGVFTNGGVRAVVDTRIGGPASDPNSVPLGTQGYISNCPALTTPPSTPTAADAATVAADYLARQNLPANCWVANEVMPGGYTPQFGGTLHDASIVGGIRGEMTDHLSYDFSGGYGRNKVSFFLNRSWNPSRGPDGISNGQLQRNFELGSYVQSEVNLNADFVLAIPMQSLASDLSFAFGAEYRDEIFETIIGEVNSWEAGRFAFQSSNGTNFYSDGVTRLSDLSIGAHGFAGFSPPQAGQWDRRNIAVYAEAEADLTDRFTGSAAVRYEDFNTFGNTTNGKLAARFAVTDAFALRASVNTGFRAPTPGQENVTKVSTILVNGELSQSGQIPPTNPIAQALGGQALTPEKSVNWSGGFVWNISDNLSLTTDYFWIQMKDRIAFTGTIDITGEDPNDPKYASLNCPGAKANPVGTLALCLQELGVPGAADLSSVSFYTNDFKTTTQGIDLVASYDHDWGNAGTGTLTAAVNWTKTRVDNAGEEVSRDKVVDLENQNPEIRGVFTYTHDINNFRFQARASYFDDWVNSQDWGDATPRGPDGTNYGIRCQIGYDDCFSGKWIMDLEGSYTFADRYTIAIGADNVFDEPGAADPANLNPDGSLGAIGSGNKYSDTTPWGIDGGFWYARFTANFD
jgi:iron complex outermembrane receptor protein